MSIDDVRDQLDDNSARNKWIGVWIGVVAVLLAVCSVGGDNATKDANRSNIDASNLWAFFQAKTIRRTVTEVQADQAELMMQTLADLKPESKKIIEERIKAWRAAAARYRTEPETREGTRELAERAKAAEKERDIALRKDPYFDFAGALLQIAIVLASVAIIIGTNMLLVVSLALGALGAILMINGFTLAFALPFLG